MRTHTLHPLFLLLTSLASACFSPDLPVDDGGSETGDDGSGPTTTSAATTTAGTTAGTEGSTEATSTSDAPTSDAPTTDAPTTDAPTTDATESSTTDEPAESTGGPLPYCGDGQLDADEECDDGDDNAYANGCLPDCVLNVCGDEHIHAGVEACDNGESENVLEVGACAPDCSRVIEEKVITGGGGIDNGYFGNNPVAFADAACDPGYLALFAYPGVREATTTAFDSVGAIDWVLQPYTAYTRDDGTLLWITDDVPLLGVRDGAQQPLLAGVFPECVGFCFAFRQLSGIANDWTTAVSHNCSFWSSSSAGVDATVGNPYSASDFLDNGESPACDEFALTGVYCVEQ